MILVINCGSSSAKYELFDIEKESALCSGNVERIGAESSSLTHECVGGCGINKKIECRDHHHAMEIIRDVLTDPETGVITDAGDVKGVGHRVVHGGEEFSSSTLIDEKVLSSIEKYSVLAPLHNPPSLEGIRACTGIFKGVPQVAVFDTAFHQTMPEYAFVYGIPYEFYEKYGIRRYGFHGTSHRYVASKAADVLSMPLSDVNIITVHLGNGCSIAAVEKGKSVDTSMGFTPLEGLLMGTRSGDLDPAAVTYVMDRENIGVDQMNSLLNKKSGLLGVSGVSNDMRDIISAIEKGDKRAKLAYDIFVYRIIKYVGAYAAVLGSVDAVVFTAGIGENVSDIKDRVAKKMKILLGEKTKFLTLRTNEELLIAKDTYGIVKKG
jgi:acetate kinase